MPQDAHPRQVKELIERLGNDPRALEAFRADPLPMLIQVASRERHPQSDTFLYRLVVMSLAAVIVGIVGIELIIRFEAFWNNTPPSRIQTLPEFLVAACSTSIGALAGLLAPIPSGRT